MLVAYTISNSVLTFLPNDWRPKNSTIEDISNSNISFKSFLQVLRQNYLHFVCPLKVGLPAPNINILTLDGVKKKLLEFEKKGRPLVVNFGSCTWSPFMSTLDAFNKVVSEFDSSADFVAVYISEAHPLEGWALKDNKYSIGQLSQIEDRRSAAEMLKDAGIACPVVMDTMKNQAIDEYAALPEALYIIEDGDVKLKCLGPFTYNPEHVRKWLQSYVKRH